MIGFVSEVPYGRAHGRNLRSACHGCFEVKEVWWDRSHYWSTALSGYSIFQKEHNEEVRMGSHPFGKEQLEFMELYLGLDDEPPKS